MSKSDAPVMSDGEEAALATPHPVTVEAEALGRAHWSALDKLEARLITVNSPLWGIACAVAAVLVPPACAARAGGWPTAWHWIGGYVSNALVPLALITVALGTAATGWSGASWTRRVLLPGILALLWLVLGYLGLWWWLGNLWGTMPWLAVLAAPGCTSTAFLVCLGVLTQLLFSWGRWLLLSHERRHQPKLWVVWQCLRCLESLEGKAGQAKQVQVRTKAIYAIHEASVTMRTSFPRLYGDTAPSVSGLILDHGRRVSRWLEEREPLVALGSEEQLEVVKEEIRGVLNCLYSDDYGLLPTSDAPRSPHRLGRFWPNSFRWWLATLIPVIALLVLPHMHLLEESQVRLLFSVSAAWLLMRSVIAIDPTSKDTLDVVRSLVPKAK